VTKTIHHPAYVAMIQRLRARRIELGLTQEAVAARMGVHRTWVNKVEAYERRLDFIETVDLCRLYRIKLSDLARCIGS
jgi:transcriptional regulator with XRE-family HTH domain